MISAGAVALGLLLAGSARGPIVLDVDALGPITVRVTSKVKDQLPPPVPTGEQSKALTDLGPEARAELRSKLTRSSRELLEGVGFEVRDRAEADEPVFAIRANVVPDTCGDRAWVQVQVQVEVDEAAVWVRDPTRKGHIVVWSHTTTHRVRRAEGARTLEQAWLDGVRAFTEAQVGAGAAGAAPGR